MQNGLKHMYAPPPVYGLVRNLYFFYSFPKQCVLLHANLSTKQEIIIIVILINYFSFDRNCA